jgi:capsular exopolysaccharide synthesis family protein
MALTLTTKPLFESTSTIELNKSSKGSSDLGIDDVLSQQFSSAGDSLLVDQQTETAILQSDSLALAVIEKLGLASKPPFVGKSQDNSEKGLPLQDAPVTRTRLLRIFRRSLKVDPIRGTRLIQVSFESQDPRQAAEIANALIEGYKNQYLQSHYEATSETSDWLTKQLSDLKANVEESEKKLTDYEKENGILNLNVMPTSNDTSSGQGSQVHSVTIEKLDALNSELTAAEANRIEKEAIYHIVASNNGDIIVGLANDPLAAQSNSMVLTQGGGLSNLEMLRQQQNQVKISLAQASTTFGANNRHLKELQTQLHTMDEQIQQEMHQIVLRAQGDFQLARQTEDQIRQRFDKQQIAASKLNEKTVQFSVLSQEAYSRKKLYEDLYTKLQEANVSAGLKATNITIVNPARSESIPIRPRPVYNLALGALFGIFIGVSSAYAVDSLDRTVSNPMEVEEITGRPVIGVIPNFVETDSVYGPRLTSLAKKIQAKELAAPEAPRDPMSVWMINHPDSAPAEAFRVLRTSILLSRPGGGLKTLLVTGCTPGEGKTTVTTNLAVAFAQHGKKVIIIEADMRRPKLMRKLDIPNKVGLSNVLAGTSSIDAAILHSVHVPTLDILPAGPRPPMPSEILGSTAFDELLDRLRSTYDIILIDSPPALLVTDAVSISTKADAVIWVAQAGVITRPYLARAAHVIDRNGMRVIGFVVNRISPKISGYGYGYEYEVYGSEYGEENRHDA